MPGDRPSLRETARTWLETATAGSSSSDDALREALANFVDNRYAGAADDLRGVHDLRRRYFGDERTLASLSATTPGPGEHVTLDKAASASAPVDQGRLLFQLVRAFRPRRVLELGTNLGISGAYIALGLRHGGGGTLTTIEVSRVRLELARAHFAELGLDHIETVQGYFDDVLGDALSGGPRVEVAFVDGNHRREATLTYFELLRGHMGSGRLVVFDDIRWSEGMRQAWEVISTSPAAGRVVDLGRTGLVVTA